MENRYQLTLEQNLFLAKRNLVDNIYANARMEGLNVTFPQTKTILEGVNVPQLKVDEIQCILNLRDAWNYTITHIKEPFNLEFICKVNEFVARNESLAWGNLRNRKCTDNWNKLHTRNYKTRKSRRKITRDFGNFKYNAKSNRIYAIWNESTTILGWQ